MSRIIEPSRRVTAYSYQLVFNYADEPGSGFSFECTEKGEPLNLTAVGRQNYERCVANSHDRPLVACAVQRFDASYRQPAKLKCDCGAVLELADPMTNKCRCSHFYNGSGQALCHPRLWGEETGERFDDEGHFVL